MSAGERRADVLEAAMAEFALGGLHGTSTEGIAGRAGVSQPYLFRLYGTKKDLFLAALEGGFDRVESTFAMAAEAHPDRPLEAMGQAYVRLVSQREQLLLQMQGYAACSDPDVQSLMQRRFGKLYVDVQSMSGASDADVSTFFQRGMFLNVVTAMDLFSILDQDWVRQCLAPVP
jgi:AcrR family transcriptional regulator